MRFPLLAAVLLSGCGDDEKAEPTLPPLDIPEGCNPIASEWDCLLPFPSDQFLKDDATLPAGKRFEVPEAAQVHDKDGAAVNLGALFPADGFSPGTQILALFPSGVDDTELVFHTDDVKKSLGDSATVLLDADTGERVLHFAEVDPRAEDDARRGLVVRPLVRLSNEHHYVVALRRLHDPAGALIEPPEGFRRLRDKQTRGDPVLAPLAQHFEKDVFAPLAEAGVARSELQLAWDFSTRSEENQVGDLLAVRKDLLDRLAKAEPSFAITSVEKDVNDHVAIKIQATVKVPKYVEKDAPMTPLLRDADGNVAPSGELDVPFSIMIPKSVANRKAGDPPARLMQYGHGFFGSRSEAEDLPSEVADKLGFVVVAANWVGMSDEDRIPVVNHIVDDAATTLMFTDRVHQAMANFISVAAVARGKLAQAPELSVQGTPAYDASALYFWGNSMGHILGGTYVALSPSIERVALGVGGADFSYIMFRSQPFNAFLLFVGIQFPDALDQQKFAVLTQMSFDRIDPLSVAPHVVTDTYPGSPAARHVLMHSGLGDAAVNPLAAELHARALGIPYLTPAPREIAGLSSVGAPTDSALVEFDFGIDPPPGLKAIPPVDGTPVHEAVRRLDATQAQLDAFFRPDGSVIQTCDGVCDPE